MTAVRCSNCAADLSGRELDDGWCNACGKSIPSFVYREAGLKGRKEKAIPQATRTPMTTSATSMDPEDRPAGWQLALIGLAMIGLATVIVLAFV